jgi:hypothetical protein
MDVANQWGGVGAKTNTSDLYMFIDTGANPLSPALNNVNLQFYGFENPGPNSSATISSISRGVGGNTIEGQFGTLTFELTGDSGALLSPMLFDPADITVSWVPANGQIADHLLIFVDNLNGFQRGEIGFKIMRNSLTTTAATTGRSIVFAGSSGNPADDFYVGFKNYSSGGGGGGGGNSTPASTPAPAKYSGPEFSGLSGMGIMTGNSGKLEGKRLDEISSIEIGGKAATFTATSATELSLSLPAGLAPGLYDLVINSSAGKLTHINAIQVRAPKQSFSIMTRSQGKISNDQYLEHSLIASMQIPELNKARCVVNASSMAMARAMADRLCAIVKASNPNIETTVVEPRSSVKGDAVFARVSYGWN